LARSPVQCGFSRARYIEFEAKRSQRIRSATMNGSFRAVCAIATASLLLACSTAPTKQDQGMIIGAIAGGILGHQVGGGSGQVLATMIGTVAGAAIGGSIGRTMDETDRINASATLENVRTGVPSSWVNPDTGYEYVMTPINTYDSCTGPCREYTLDANIGGKTEQIYGTACRQADGSWRVVD
jgi:surface antigen